MKKHSVVQPTTKMVEDTLETLIAIVSDHRSFKFGYLNSNNIKEIDLKIKECMVSDKTPELLKVLDSVNTFFYDPVNFTAKAREFNFKNSFNKVQFTADLIGLLKDIDAVGLGAISHSIILRTYDSFCQMKERASNEKHDESYLSLDNKKNFFYLMVEAQKQGRVTPEMCLFNKHCTNEMMLRSFNEKITVAQKRSPKDRLLMQPVHLEGIAGYKAILGDDWTPDKIFQMINFTIFEIDQFKKFYENTFCQEFKIHDEAHVAENDAYYKKFKLKYSANKQSRYLSHYPLQAFDPVLCNYTVIETNERDYDFINNVFMLDDIITHGWIDFSKAARLFNNNEDQEFYFKLSQYLLSLILCLKLYVAINEEYKTDEIPKKGKKKK